MHLKRTFDFSSFTVMICTPSEFACGLMSDMCRAMRFKAVISKLDFVAAWDTFKTNPIDIMFGDVVAEDGYRLLKEVRNAETSPNPHIPYIATALAVSSSCIARARDTGATEFLRFPLSAERLIERIVHVVDHPRTFVKSAGYTGPDRRRKHAPIQGDDRRRKTSGAPGACDNLGQRGKADS